ncbi:hypothetical protein Tco_0460396, partial [Tanacetum coccineum]
TGLHKMAMASFESQYIDKDTYSSSAEDIEVQSCFVGKYKSKGQSSAKSQSTAE